ENDAVLSGLNRVIGRYTNNQVASLTTQRVGSVSSQRLVDQRMPGWAVWEWAAIGDLFVVSFGDGALVRMVESLHEPRRALAGDEWFRRAESGCNANRGWLEAILNHRQAERRLPEETVARIRSAIGKLGHAGVDRDLWVLGLDAREWTLRRCCLRSAGTTFTDYTTSQPANDALRGRIPPAARPYALLPVAGREMVQ